MKRDNRFKVTRKAAEAPLAFTRSAVEQSKRLRTPSPKAAHIGTASGGCVGGGLLLTGAVQLLTGRPLWALGALSAGLVAVILNLLCHHRSKKQT